MEIFILAGLVVVAILIIKFLAAPKTDQDKKEYIFSVKESVMTRAEGNFFNKLHVAVGEKYYIFPQLHLSTFLYNKTERRYWRAAFRTINQKSVDYVLVDKITFKPILAIELDDWSHETQARKVRDTKVNELLHKSGIRLVRFPNGNISPEEIALQVSSQSVAE